MTSEEKGVGLVFGIILLLVVGLGVAFFWGGPHYTVWSQGMKGTAELRRAEQNKQIQIEQAKAELESAKLRAQAIAIEGEMAAKYPEFRTQQFIGAFAQAMENGSIEKIIYVPTEAGIPILERK